MPSFSLLNPSNFNVVCQICSNVGHSAFGCPQFHNFSYAAPNASSNFAALFLNDSSDQQWYMDSGASSHMTFNSYILAPSSICSRMGSVIVGNGDGLKIMHTSSSSLSTNTRSFPLSSLLHVPSICKNLIFVRQFTRDNNCSIELYLWGFCIKDLKTGSIQHINPNSGPLYLTSTVVGSSTTAASAFVVGDRSIPLWHACIGHPGPSIINMLRLQNSISFPLHDLRTFQCTSYLACKSVNLPFQARVFVSSRPFQIVHYDIWTSLIFVAGYRYYIIFIDDFSRNVWLFPLSRKSDVFSCF